MANRTSQFMFPKDFIEYQNAKIVKSKFKNEKSKKKKHKNHVVLKENKKKDIKIESMCYVTFRYVFDYLTCMYL